MVFAIGEIKGYLNKCKNIKDAIENLSEQSIVDCIPVDCLDSLNYDKNNENLLKYESQIGMTKLKEEQQTIYRNSNGGRGRKWMACSPKWISGRHTLKTEYAIFYWVNYGDDMTYGAFSVEEIKQWFSNPEIYLHEIGGTKER